MKLSIVVCVYNTRVEYLEKCLDSITHSTLSLGEYEICIVDDGSELDYSQVQKKYGTRYTKHKNRGILFSRLRGIEMADGDYITFVDSDDTVSVNYHFPMIAMSEGADIIVNDWAFHTDKSRYVCILDKLISGDVYKKGVDLLPFFVSEGGKQHSLFVLWNKVFKSEVLKGALASLRDISERYPLYNYSEDALISFFAYKNARTLKNIHTGYYFYRIHSGQSVTIETKDKLISHIDCMSRTLDIMYDLADEHPTPLSIREKIDDWRELMSRTHYSYAKTGGYTELYPYILERYKVKELRKSTLDDGKNYLKVKVLAKNFEEIDRAIYSSFSGRRRSLINKKGLSDYSKLTLEFISEHSSSVKFSDTPSTVIPREKYSIMQTIIHNYAISRLGLLLFPKGSKIRAFLKKHL